VRPPGSPGGERVCGAPGTGAGTVRAVRLVLVVNSAASSVTRHTRVVIAKALSADFDCSVVDTQRRGHATRIAAEAATRGDGVVVVLGGDGTLNEAANGLAGSDTALAALPGGSTNVLARSLGWPRSPVEATGALLESLANNAVRSVSLGSANGRYFLFCLGVGLDANVMHRAERRHPLKRWVASGLYVWSTVATVASRKAVDRCRFGVHLADGEVVDDAEMVVVANTRPLTYLGARPLEVSPDAALDAPLTVTAARRLRPTVVAGLAARALSGPDRLVRSRHVVYATGQDHVTIRGYGGVPHQMDGEYLGLTEHLEVRDHPGALRLVVPHDSHDDQDSPDSPDGPGEAPNRP